MGEMSVPEKQVQCSIATPWTGRRAAIALRIELAALQLAVDRDLDALTVDDIAAAADISRRTFYRYFETIDDVFAEMPRRSMQQLARDIRARPASEKIVEAYINALRNRRPSDEERDLRRLTLRVALRSPDAYWRAVHRNKIRAKETVARAIADRLRASGQDPSPAPLIALVMLVTTGHISEQSGPGGEFQPDPDRVEAALKTIANIMNDIS